MILSREFWAPYLKIRPDLVKDKLLIFILLLPEGESQARI
jgi:hypothetical protein